MSLFAVSFVLEDGADYAARHAALVVAIETAAVGEVWCETTSFYLLTSTLNSPGLREAIAGGADLQKGDTLVVLNISQTRGHASRGVADKALFKRLMEQRH
ncbi:hypothetical protein N8A98_00310 (plasmid) [Devosia neptuniae]|uniref:Uncharacterized protein n=1 Tax=Devosia neptuniae TaxID=191302 RepID=A0ABY6C6X4_9HYPH|nr:hypothetical protein [Devosia neptuniae]UXN68000.1 hypothetical protein N8A98_00310 [Devosia neptuniae]